MSEPDFPYDKKPRDVPSRGKKVLPAPKEPAQLVSARPPIPILGINSSILFCQTCGKIFITEEELNVHTGNNH